MSELIAAHDLPAGHFPFTVHFIAVDTHEVLHTITVDGPGPVRVPGFAPRKVAVEIVYATGERIYQEPE